MPVVASYEFGIRVIPPLISRAVSPPAFTLRVGPPQVHWKQWQLCCFCVGHKACTERDHSRQPGASGVDSVHALRQVALVHCVGGRLQDDGEPADVVAVPRIVCWTTLGVKLESDRSDRDLSELMTGAGGDSDSGRLISRGSAASRLGGFFLDSLHCQIELS